MSRDIKISNRIVHSFLIAIKASVITSSFIVMINFFNQTIDYANLSSSLPTIATMCLAWLVVVIVIARSITNNLIEENLSDIAFLFFYILIVASTTQLGFQIYKNLNNDLVDILPFIGLVTTINLIFTPLILQVIDTTRLSKKQQKTALFSAILYCAVVTFFISFISAA